MSIAPNIMRGNKRAYPCIFCPKEHTSITTFFGVIGSDELMGWSGRVGTKKLKMFSDALKRTKITDETYKKICAEVEKQWDEENLKDGKSPSFFWDSSYEINKKSTDTGTVVHAAIEADLIGKPTDALRGDALKAYQAYLDWKSTVTLETIATEKTSYNCVMDYACTRDWSGKLNGKLTLGDWKTSTGIFEKNITQCWANAIADEMQNGNILYEQVMVGCFKKDGTSEVLIIPRKGLENGFGGYEEARELIKATIPWFKYKEAWKQKFPYIPKTKNKI